MEGNILLKDSTINIWYKSSNLLLENFHFRYLHLSLKLLLFDYGIWIQKILKWKEQNLFLAVVSKALLSRAKFQLIQLVIQQLSMSVRA